MASTTKYRTNLNCNACVAAVQPHLDSEPSIESWEVDISAPEKTLTVHGVAVSEEKVRDAVAKGGFKVLNELPLPSSAMDAKSLSENPTKTTYYPLILIFAFLMGTVILVELGAGGLIWERAMSNFMGGFFLVFSFFKLLDLRGFADSYQMYDVVAQRVRGYGYIYPFIEMLLGAAYLTGFQPVLTNLVTLIVMSVSAVGVMQSLMARRKIRCACLGTIFNLPMSTVTLVEDTLMAAMAALMLWTGSHHEATLGQENHSLSDRRIRSVRAQAMDEHAHQSHRSSTSDFSLKVNEESVREAGEKSMLSLFIQRNDGTIIKEFDTMHEERIHLVVVRQGLDTFAHLHPDISVDGTLVVPYVFPFGGTYRLYADFQPAGETPITASTSIIVAGESPQASALHVDVPGRVHGDHLIADITVERGKENQEATLHFVLLDHQGQPVQNLKPYLGAWGHLQIISADGEEYVHSHPLDEKSTSPPSIVSFHATFQNGGRYKAWAQFMVGDLLQIVPFVMDIEAHSNAPDTHQ